MTPWVVGIAAAGQRPPAGCISSAQHQHPLAAQTMPAHFREFLMRSPSHVRACYQMVLFFARIAAGLALLGQVRHILRGIPAGVLAHTPRRCLLVAGITIRRIDTCRYCPDRRYHRRQRLRAGGFVV